MVAAQWCAPLEVDSTLCTHTNWLHNVWRLAFDVFPFVIWNLPIWYKHWSIFFHYLTYLHLVNSQNDPPTTWRQVFAKETISRFSLLQTIYFQIKSVWRKNFVRIERKKNGKNNLQNGWREKRSIFLLENNLRL